MFTGFPGRPLAPVWLGTFARGTALPPGLCRCVGWAQINVFSGHVRALAIKDLLFHDGASGTTQAFSAGRYSGILEIQHAGVTTVPSYVWEAGRYTYVLMGPPSKGSTPVPLVKAIASFR